MANECILQRKGNLIPIHYFLALQILNMQELTTPRAGFESVIQSSSVRTDG